MLIQGGFSAFIAGMNNACCWGDIFDESGETVNNKNLNKMFEYLNHLQNLSKDFR